MAVVDLEWGRAGAERLRDKVALLIVVDILSFSTAVDIATGRGAIIHPFAYGDRAAAERAAAALGAQLAAPRRAGGGQLSLSPRTLAEIAPGTRLMLPSPNGSRISLATGDVSTVAGSLRNVAAIAAWARRTVQGDIGVIPAGETWPDGSLRPAIEDLLGAGAIVDALDLPVTPEAEIAREAFRSAGARLGPLIRSSISGRELLDDGFDEDVELALACNASHAVPLLVDGAYRNVAV
jgi:2-phosphosulfolactate phosphatase